MKHLVFITASAFILQQNLSYGQELNVISSSGTYTETASGSVSWTIGEAIIETGTGGSFEVTQGFHQSNIWVVGVEELAELEISIFPNPTTEFVTIVTPYSIKLSIYDMSGRLVATHHLTDESTQLDVNEMSRGAYNMIFESKDHKTKSAKLVVQ